MWQNSQSDTKTCWILKCDIRKFFANIDQQILVSILQRHIEHTDIFWLIEAVIKSFDSGRSGVGMPLGNLTSQILVNIYMNKFDQWVKRVMKARYYIRYADDFVIFENDKEKLLEFIPKIAEFLGEELKLELHPDKVFVKTLASGVDFLGWTHFHTHCVLRTKTKKRMLRRLENIENKESTLPSYCGLLRHGNAFKLQRMIGCRE